jgi:hypothetical protein
MDLFMVQHGHYLVKLSDLDTLPLDASGNELGHRMPGLGADYDLISLGVDSLEGGEGLDADISSPAGASLVGTWFGYTLTSAIDIDVDTKPRQHRVRIRQMKEAR